MMAKSLFNFYLDDELKKSAMEKLETLNGKKEKGQLAALLRIMLKQFVATPNDKVNPLLLQAIDAEYEYCTKTNKRSKM